MVPASRLALLKKLHTNAFEFQRGIERETLRADARGHIAQTPHPKALGSALTHASITTDYSESLLEFITGVHSNTDELLKELSLLHRFTYAQLNGEVLWPSSMPTALPEQENIPIAYYGDSHIGKLKTIYRHGLWHRYGRKMQTIAGVHFNWSVSDEFWRQWAILNGKTGDLTPFISDEYFGLIRGFRRHSWLLLYLFGSSPAADGSFLDHNSEGLIQQGDTLIGEYATSLRMSDLGYSNQAQSELFVCFNSLKSYADTLIGAINQPYPAYEKIGVKVDEHYRQLNANLLQIENEYYSDIRPKRTAYSGEKPIHALRNRGVEYLEVRCLDVNPFDPIGINRAQIDFMDVFLLWCLIQDNSTIDSEECRALQKNNLDVAIGGRRPNATLFYRGSQRKLSEVADEAMNSLMEFAEILDQQIGSKQYQAAVSIQAEKIARPELLPSSQVLNGLSKQRDFREFCLTQAQQFADYFLQPLSNEERQHWQLLAKESLVRQKDIEQASYGAFDDFLAQYLRQ